MLPAPAECREQIRWFVDGRPLRPEEWVCTQYVGRGRTAAEGEDVVQWEARMPLAAFEGVYAPADEEERRELAAAPSGEDMTPAQRRLVEGGCPGLSALLQRDAGLLRDFVLEADCDLLERMWMDERPARTAGYAVQRVVDLRSERDEVRVLGTAVRAEGGARCTS